MADTDGPPCQSLGVDFIDHDVMREPRRKKDEPIISRRNLIRVGPHVLCPLLCAVGRPAHVAPRSDDDVCTFLFLIYMCLSETQTFSCFVFLDLISAIQKRRLSCSLTQNQMLIVRPCLFLLPDDRRPRQKVDRKSVV